MPLIIIIKVEKGIREYNYLQSVCGCVCVCVCVYFLIIACSEGLSMKKPGS